MMRSDEVRIDGQPEYSEALIEIVLPNGSVPLFGSSLKKFGAPNVVYKHSMWPWVLLMSSARTFTWSGSRWSTATEQPTPPRRVTSSAVSSIVSARLYSDRANLVLRPVQMTVAPASPKAAAMPRPAPRVAPATTATRPRSAFGSGDHSIARLCQLSPINANGSAELFGSVVSRLARRSARETDPA